MIVHVCDECGARSHHDLFLQTGHVFVDGEWRGQNVDLCEAHKPIPVEGQLLRPNNCVRVRFHWPSEDGPVLPLPADPVEMGDGMICDECGHVKNTFLPGSPHQCR